MNSSGSATVLTLTSSETVARCLAVYSPMPPVSTPSSAVMKYLTPAFTRAPRSSSSRGLMERMSMTKAPVPFAAARAKGRSAPKARMAVSVPALPESAIFPRPRRISSFRRSSRTGTAAAASALRAFVKSLSSGTAASGEMPSVFLASERAAVSALGSFPGPLG